MRSDRLRRSGVLLGLVLSVVTCSAPDERALRLNATVLSNATLLEVGPTPGRLGVGLGGRVGLALGLSERLEVGPAFDVRHDFASGHSDVFGSARIVSRFDDRVAIVSSVGYGLGSFSAPVPQHLIVIGTGLAVRGGHFWFSLETEVVFRVVVTGSRTIRVLGAVTFEHDLLG